MAASLPLPACRNNVATRSPVRWNTGSSFLSGRMSHVASSSMHRLADPIPKERWDGYAYAGVDYLANQHKSKHKMEFA
ncbi:hypothetical protein [Oryza sativa Japonica Group]|uniref:Uncharacterized protein n=1 Tax=Oryza sativa subsp. japonica TaxID=39947 RepID=Q5NBH0_ORYSJ|nr:hypothetical protein [Oryza sativa Japonica Group]